MPSLLQRIFRAAPEAKASRTLQALAITGAGRPVWTPRDYGALAREGFQRNAVVHRAVRLVSEAAASMPLVVREGGREADAHPLLALLARPNPREAGPRLLESVYGHLLVSGNAYLEAVQAGASRGSSTFCAPTGCGWCPAPTAGPPPTTTRRGAGPCAWASPPTA